MAIYLKMFKNAKTENNKCRARLPNKRLESSVHFSSYFDCKMGQKSMKVHLEMWLSGLSSLMQVSLLSILLVQKVIEK